MRDSSSVKLIWSLSLAPGSGGVGVLGAGLQWLRILASGLLARLALGLALGALGLVFLLLDLPSLGRTLLNLGLGLCQRAQAVLTPGDLGGYIHAIGHRLGVAALR